MLSITRIYVALEVRHKTASWFFNKAVARLCRFALQRKQLFNSRNSWTRNKKWRSHFLMIHWKYFAKKNTNIRK